MARSGGPGRRRVRSVLAGSGRGLGRGLAYAVPAVPAAGPSGRARGEAAAAGQVLGADRGLGVSAGAQAGVSRRVQGSGLGAACWAVAGPARAPSRRLAGAVSSPALRGCSPSAQARPHPLGRAGPAPGHFATCRAAESSAPAFAPSSWDRGPAPRAAEHVPPRTCRYGRKGRPAPALAPWASGRNSAGAERLPRGLPFGSGLERGPREAVLEPGLGAAVLS